MLKGSAYYKLRSPVPNALLALYGSACYQQLGEDALARIATPGASNGWGFDTVLTQPIADWRATGKTGSVLTAIGKRR